MANDIVFLLRFDTEEGQRQVQQFATRAGQAIAKALNVQVPAGQGLSRALGLKEALADITTAQAKLSGLGATLSKLNLSQLDDLRTKLIRRGSIPPRNTRGLEPTEDILIIDEARKTVRRREALQEHLQPFVGTSRAREQASLESRRTTEPAVASATALRTQANRRRGLEALINQEIEAAETARDRALVSLLAPFRGVVDASNRASLESRRSTNPVIQQATAARTQANRRRGLEALVTSEVEAADAARLERRKPKLREQELKQIERNIELTKSDLQRNALVSRQERTLETQRLDGLRRNVQNLREQNTRGVDGDIVSRRTEVLQERLARVRRRTRLSGDPGSSSSGNALGISIAATNLLAFSSVVGQLSPRLGAVTMQAGFAAFSLGGVVAGLSLVAAATSGYIGLLKKAIDTTKQAGLMTTQYTKAQIGLNLEIQGFLKVLGVKTQLAFAPVVDELSELTKELHKLPWDELISASAEASKGLLQVAQVLSFVERQSGLFRLLRQADAVQDAAGLVGKQRVDLGKIIGSGQSGGFGILGGLQGFKAVFQEMKEVFGKPGEAGTRFVYTPKFDFKPIEDVGRTIQESLLKNESKDPLTRALEVQNGLLRQIFIELQDIGDVPIEDILERVNPGIVVRD